MGRGRRVELTLGPGGRGRGCRGRQGPVVEAGAEASELASALALERGRVFGDEAAHARASRALL